MQDSHVSRRDILKSTALIGATFLIGGPRRVFGMSDETMTIRVFNAPETSFGKTSVLVSGKKDLVLIDGTFSLENARSLLRQVNELEKRLTTVFVSYNDPDYYFGLEVIRDAYPKAKILALSGTIDKIKATYESKLKTWEPTLKEDAPKKIVIPELLDQPTIDLEGDRLEIKGFDTASQDRPYVWIPTLQAIVGGIQVFGGLHVWTADTPTQESREAWIQELDGMIARKAEIVVPGHNRPQNPYTAANLTYTKKYLIAFNKAAERARNSAELISEMKRLYPKAGMVDALVLGAKVVKEEMKWG